MEADFQGWNMKITFFKNVFGDRFFESSIRKT